VPATFTNTGDDNCYIT